MKTASFFLLCCCLVSCIGSSSLPPDAFENLPAHPRILLTSSDLLRIQTRAKEDTLVSRLISVINTESEKLLDLPAVSYQKHGRRLLQVSREARRRIAFLAFQYRFTGQDRFLKRAEREMLTIATFKDWNPSHFLDVAEMTTGMAMGFDWLYENLSTRSRKTIRDAIIE